MPNFSIHNPQNLHQITEGTVSVGTREIKDIVNDPAPPFYRMVILEVISDPYIIDFEKISYWKNVIGVTNSRFAGMLPRNTVVAQRIYTAANPLAPPMFLFPFFPSHLALPCKPGEMVWAMFEDPNSQMKEIGYWFCRITEPHVADDVNHTHHPMQLDTSLKKGTIDKFNESPKANDQQSSISELLPIYELRNGLVVEKKDGTRVVAQNAEMIKTPGSVSEEVIEELVTNTDASVLHAYEAVPRFKKRPGDVVLEGSNNTLIVLGTDRQGPLATYDETVKEKKPPDVLIPKYPETDFKENAGSIDLVVGRGNETGAANYTKVARIVDGQELFKTVAKTPEMTLKNEGDPDYNTDRSRILISQRTRTDAKFGIDAYMQEQLSVQDTPVIGDASVVIKSDKIRLIARSDISLIVTNSSEASIPIDIVPGNPATPMLEKISFRDNADQSLWASIVIKNDGNIIFTPSANGFIKLGGNDADKAILCTDFSADLAKEEGQVNALPIATTGGGFVGTAGGNVDEDAVARIRAPDLGTFSKKVLIK
jgi:hypothetical protein